MAMSNAEPNTSFSASFLLRPFDNEKEVPLAVAAATAL